MASGISTLRRTISALVIVLLLLVGMAPSALAGDRRGRRAQRGDRGRHLGWTIGRHRGWDRRDDNRARRDRRRAWKRHRKEERRGLRRHWRDERREFRRGDDNFRNRRELRAHQRAEWRRLRAHQRNERRERRSWR